MTINVHLTILRSSEADADILRKLNQTLEFLKQINQKENKIMSLLDDANTALDTIAAETTKQGLVLSAEAVTLQTVSEEVKQLILDSKGTLPADFVTRLQSVAAKTSAISATIQANADFSTKIATEGANNPVPVPVPDPTSPVTA